MRALFFDFDGVIIESNEIKTEAFRRLFIEHGEKIANDMAAFHNQNGGVSRYIKFKHFYNTYLKREPTEQEMSDLNLKFRRLCLDGVKNAPFKPGVLEFIRRHYEDYICFIISGTPTEELREITGHLELNGYFKEICGSPPGKIELLKRLLAEHQIDSSRSYFFGDARTDLEAAKFHKIPFWLLRGPGNRELESLSEYVSQDFEDWCDVF